MARKPKPTAAALLAASMHGDAKRVQPEVVGYEFEGETYWLTSDGRVLDKFCVVRDLAPGVFVVEEYEGPLKRFARRAKAAAVVILKALDITPLGGIFTKVLGKKALGVIKTIATANPEDAAAQAILRLFGGDKAEEFAAEIQKALADGVVTAGELEAAVKKFRS